MATIVFDGTTLWDDSDTGNGAVQINEQMDTIRQTVVAIPRYGGNFVKTHGQEPGGVVLGCNYTLTSGEINTLVTLLESVKNGYGELSFPPGRTLQTCRLFSMGYTRSRPVQDPVGVIKYNVYVNLVFKVLKP